MIISNKPARKPGELAGPELATVVGCAGPPGPITKKSYIDTSSRSGRAGMYKPAKKTAPKNSLKIVFC